MATVDYILPKKDPLTLDLDGDGLEATTPNPLYAIQFDHDGDGAKTGSGWISADDGFLTLDRNANGTIDSGAELFGDSTPLTGGGTAKNGFDALAQEDTNHDGVVNASDTRFAQLRVWRDLNQDGISQTGANGSTRELFTLAELGITSLTVAATGSGNNNGANNNRIAETGGYTRTVNGSSVTRLMGDIDLMDAPFRRTFATTIPLITAATTLPDMQGSGWTRDLREAMSLASGAANTPSASLIGAVTAFGAGNTRAAQRATLDSIVQPWALSSGRVGGGTLDSAYSYVAPSGAELPQGSGVAYARVANATPTAAPVLVYEFAGVTRLVAGSGEMRVQSTNQQGQATAYQYTAPATTVAYEAMMHKLKVLEVFNAQPFVDTRGFSAGGWANKPAYVSNLYGGTSHAGDNVYVVSLSGGDMGQVDLINRAYDSLNDSVYEALAKQTRLAAYMDTIELSFVNSALTFNFAGLDAKLNTRYGTDKVNAIIDLAELLRYDGDSLRDAGWMQPGADKLRGCADAVNEAWVLKAA